MWLRLSTAPTTTPVSLAEAKLHLRVETSETAEDELITQLIAAATANLEGREGLLGRALMVQSWEWRINRFPPAGTPILVPFPPLSTVIKIGYLDPDGVEQTVATSVYVVEAETFQGQVRLAYGESWPSIRNEPYAVRIEFTAGYPDAAQVPDPIRAAIKLMVGDAYRNRETVAIGETANAIPMSTTVENLVAPYKVHWV